MGTFPVFKYGGKGVDVALRTEYDPPGVFWSHRFNSYVLVADPERGPWNYKGKRVALVSVNASGEMRWDVRVPIRPGAWSGTDDSEPATKHFGLTPWVSSMSNRRHRMVRRNSEGGFVVSGPEGVSAYRMLALKSMLKLEMLGMKHSRGSAFATIKREFGLKGSKQKVFEQFQKMCADVVEHRAKPPGFNPGSRKGSCTCIFWHAVTPEERTAAKKMLAHSRSVGDSMGTMIAFKSLTEKCHSAGRSRNPLTRREQGKVLGLAAQAGKRYERYDERNVEDDFYSGSALGKQSAYKHVARRFGPRKSVRKNVGPGHPNYDLGNAAHRFMSYNDLQYQRLWRDVTLGEVFAMSGAAIAAYAKSVGTVRDRFDTFRAKVLELRPMVRTAIKDAPLRVLAGSFGLMEGMLASF